MVFTVGVDAVQVTFHRHGLLGHVDEVEDQPFLRRWQGERDSTATRNNKSGAGLGSLNCGVGRDRYYLGLVPG